MPGNEIPGSIHNFFEQDNPSQGYQSQVGDGGWPILNNNPWANTQRQNGAPLAYNSKNLAIQLSDSEQGNCMQHVQTPFVSNPCQKAELIRNHPKNQHINLNGYMHDSQGLQARSIQAEFQGDGMVSDGHNLVQTGFSAVESPQRSPNGYNSTVMMSSQRPEATEAPVNFDFLGGQQITSQHPGILQPRPIQPIRVSDMQLWQQHLLYKQLNEMTQQQQLLQLQQGVRQQNSFSQPSELGRQASSDQIPAVLSGMPINNLSNNMWSKEFVGCERKLTGSSPMFLSGNMNWAQKSPMQGVPNGLMFPHDQGQGIGTMGLVPQQRNQSLFGTPVGSTRGSMSHQSQFQGLQGPPHNFSSTQWVNPNQAGDTSMQSSAFNCFQSDRSAVPSQGFLQDGVNLAERGFQGKNVTQNATMQVVGRDATLENFQQGNHLSPSVQVQEAENLGEQVGPSCGIANLDHTEEKLLFSTDNNGNQDVSFGGNSYRSIGGYLNGNLMQNNDSFSSFPALNSGSWSALMQEAVEASSSDTGVNEEWSGSSFQKTELSYGNHSAMLYDTTGGLNLQNAPSLTSRPLSLFNDSNATSNSLVQPNFQGPMNISSQQTERFSGGTFHGSIEQPSKVVVKKPFDENHQQKQLAKDSVHFHAQFDRTSNDVWAGQTCEQPASSLCSSEMDFASHNRQHYLTQQQKVPLHSHSGNRLNGWIAQPLASTRNDDSDCDNDDKRQHDQGNNIKRTMSMETDHEGNMRKVAGTRVGPSFLSSDSRQEAVGSDTCILMTSNKRSQTGNLDTVVNSKNINLNPETNQHPLSRHQVDYGKHVAAGAFYQDKKEDITAKYQNQISGISQPSDPSMHNTDKRSGVSRTHKQEDCQKEDGLTDGFISSGIQPGENTKGGHSAEENSFQSGAASQSVVNDNLKLSGQSVCKNMGPPRFQFHPLGNLEMSTEPTGPRGQTLNFQGTSQSAAQALKNQERGYIAPSQYIGLNNALETGKGHLSDVQRNGQTAEEVRRRGAFSTHSAASASGGSDSHFSENKRAGLTSQNMLELLHKVDQSRVGKTVERLGFSEQNLTRGSHEADTSDGSSSHPQLCHSPPFQGFGLKLAPPTQHQTVSDHTVPLQTSLEATNGFSRSFDSGARQDQSRPPSSASVHALPHGTPQKENKGNKSFPFSGDNRKGVGYTNFQGNPLAATAYGLRMDQSLMQQWQQQQEQHQQQEQQQSFSSAFAPAVHDQSERLQQIGVDAKKSSHSGNREESQDGATPDQSSDASMPSSGGRLPPSRVASPADACVSATSQFYPGNVSHCEARNASSHLRNSGQQSSVVEPRSAGHHAAKLAVPQQGGFSTMLHNVWTSVSSQQRLSGIHPQKIISNVLQSRSPLPDSREFLQSPLRPGNQNKRKGESSPSELGTPATSNQYTHGEYCSMKVNSSEQIHPPDEIGFDPRAGSTSHESIPEPDPKLHSDGSPDISISSSARLHQHDVRKGAYSQDPSTDVYKGQVSSIASANHDTGAYGHSLDPSSVQKRNNYSLLQQMEAMKGANADPNQRAEKRLKGAEFGMDTSQMNWGVGQRHIYGQNTVLRKADATLPNAPFPYDTKMMNFSSKGIKENSSDPPSQVIGREVPHGLPTYKQHDLQNHFHPQGKIPVGHLAEGSEQPQINPQMAPSWFEKYGNHKNGQTLTNCAFGSFQRDTKVSGQNHVTSKVFESMGQHIVPEQNDHMNLACNLEQSTLPTTIVSNHSAPSTGHVPQVTENNMIIVPKKRKSPMPDVLPWHKEVTQGRRRLQSISIMEQKWAWATNRLTEKFEEEVEMTEHAFSTTRSRRRLILTTQLMQQILPPVPSRYLRADASTSYENVIYLIAKLILGDACSVVSCLGSHSRAGLDSGNMISGTLNVTEKEGDNHILRAVEDLIGRSKNLDNEFLRLDRRASLLDVRLECQDLEMHSIMNRFAKFHGRAPSEGVESSSMSETASRRSFPQRHVTAHALPRDLPEGAICLSL